MKDDGPRPSVVEDDAYGVPQTAADAADAMPEIDAIVAFRTLDRPVVHGEGHRIALSQRYHLGPALHAWPLLGQDKLAACEIAFGFREQDCNLQRECEVAVKRRWRSLDVAAVWRFHVGCRRAGYADGRRHRADIEASSLCEVGSAAGWRRPADQDGTGVPVPDRPAVPAPDRGPRTQDDDAVWAKREEQIRGVVESTAGLYGDLQGIAGRSLLEIDGLELPLLDGPAADAAE
jgi:hypothetical protein